MYPYIYIHTNTAYCYSDTDSMLQLGAGGVLRRGLGKSWMVSDEMVWTHIEVFFDLPPKLLAS